MAIRQHWGVQPLSSAHYRAWEMAIQVCPSFVKSRLLYKCALQTGSDTGQGFFMKRWRELRGRCVFKKRGCFFFVFFKYVCDE